MEFNIDQVNESLFPLGKRVILVDIEPSTIPNEQRLELFIKSCNAFNYELIKLYYNPLDVSYLNFLFENNNTQVFCQMLDKGIIDNNIIGTIIIKNANPIFLELVLKKKHYNAHTIKSYIITAINSDNTSDRKMEYIKLLIFHL